MYKVIFFSKFKSYLSYSRSYMLHSLLTLTSFSHMYADFKLKFNLQCLLFEHFRYVYSSVPIQPLRSHCLDPARPMSMHGPLHSCSARPNLEASYVRIMLVCYGLFQYSMFQKKVRTELSSLSTLDLFSDSTYL